MAMNRPLAPIEIVKSGMCIGCGACVADAANPKAVMRFDRFGQLKPTGSADWFRHPTERFAQLCPFSPSARNEDEIAASAFPSAKLQHPATGRYRSAYVGYAASDGHRAQGSSGGMATWVLEELLRKQWIDGAVHVAPVEDPLRSGRHFELKISRSVTEIRAAAKSRYYPVEMSGVLRIIKETPGCYAIVGVPCFIKAVQLLREQDPIFASRIVCTLALFCGHSKSARFVESFAWQLGVRIEDVSRIDFRRKDPSRPANWYRAELVLRDGSTLARDWWLLADGDWGAGYFMNSACNYCDDVTGETADVSFGDAWVEPYSSDGRGTNVVVTRSELIHDLIQSGIREGRLCLQPVDGDFVQATQAAGLRHRREGLAYRLTWRKRGIKPVKRVAPDARSQSWQRKLIYRIRYQISSWSHRIFWFARVTRMPCLYIRWAAWMTRTYQRAANRPVITPAKP
jgi:coenzyme F420-reducing hydrogenase beta subunit